MAQTVMICHRPPSIRGAMFKPYFRSGGAMLICQRFQVGPMAAPQTIMVVPSREKNAVVTPKNPT